MDSYEFDEIVDEVIYHVDQELNEQQAGPRYQRYNPEQLSVLNLLRRAQQTPRGGSVFADLLRGAYSLPGTDDEIPPIPPEHLTVKDVYFQSIAFALRAAFLATSPPAQVLTLARLMFDTPPPRTATELITTIAGIWGGAAKDIVDDAVIKAYRAVDYTINKVAVPIMSPFLAFFASGALASTIEGRIGGNVLTVMENPREVARNTATVYNYAENTLMLKGQMGDDKRFIGITFELVEYLIKYLELYESGSAVFEKAGITKVGEDFAQLLYIQWNDTIGNYDNSLSISSPENMQKLVMKLREGTPLEDDFKQAIVDFFSGVKFDENGGWTVMAGCAGAPSIPLPLVEGQSPVLAAKDGLVSFTPDGFFNASEWNAVYWKFLSDSVVAAAWKDAVSNDPGAFFENDEFLNKYISSGNTVFSTNSTLRSEFLSKAEEFYAGKYEEGEAKQKLSALEGVLGGSKISDDVPAEPGPETAEDRPGLTNLEKRFTAGETSYDDFSVPLDSLVPSRWRSLVSGMRLSPSVVKIVDEALSEVLKRADVKDVLTKINPRSYKQFVDEIIQKSVMPQVTTNNIVASSSEFQTNLEGEEAESFKKALLTGVSSDEDFQEKVYPAIGSYATAEILEFAYGNTEYTVEEVIEMIKGQLSS